jgi:deoxyribodipyrimidine photo-lyase
MECHWRIGEKGAQQRLSAFLEEGIEGYKEGRNFPSKDNVSRLSPHLHFGELSPNQMYYAAKTCGDNESTDHFCSELGWREFSYSQLYFNPDMPVKNLQKKFDAFPWQLEQRKLTAWQQGKTGIPIVDAGMRELWQSGYIHNRVRMVIGSFLVKNLLIPWQQGERWFWDCLVDADLANNSASWQWISGCGADAAPYFRIFNPVTQGQKFDPEGNYTKHFLPELAGLPSKYLFNPWQAPEAVLQQAGVVLGDNYPFPIVDLKISRQQALDAFKSLSQGNV